MAKREFSFAKLVISDNGPEGKGHERLEWDGFESEGLLGFYGMIYGNEGGDVHAHAVQNNLSRVVESCSEVIASDVARMTYLGPLRCVPDRHALAAREHDPSWSASGGQAWDLLRQKAEIQEKVNGWLGERWLNTDYRVLVRR